MTFIKGISKVDTLKHDRWWDHGSGGGVVSKNLEMSENEKKWSVIRKVSGFRVSEIIKQLDKTFPMYTSNILICSKQTKEWNGAWRGKDWVK